MYIAGKRKEDLSCDREDEGEILLPLVVGHRGVGRGSERNYVAGHKPRAGLFDCGM